MLIDGRSLWVTETNCYVVAPESGGPGVVVDAPPDLPALSELLARYRLLPVALVLTHGHVDHMGGAGSFHRAFGTAVFAHPDDDFLTRDPDAQLRLLFGVAPPGEFVPPEHLERLADGQRLTLAGLDLEVRHTPGHTPGHCCFYLESEGVLFSGDQLFAGSIGRTDLPGGSLTQLLESMDTKVLTLPADTQVLPGHGLATTLGTELRSNPFLVELRR